MDFLKFLRTETNRSLRIIIIMAGLAGLSTAFLLGIINLAAQSVAKGDENVSHLFMFIVLLGLFVFTEKYMLAHGVGIIEDILQRVRNRIASKILKTDVLNLDKIGASEIYNRMSSGTAMISKSAGVLVASLQSLIMIFFVLLYIATLSLVAFAMVIGMLAIAIWIYLSKQKKIKMDLQDTNKSEIEFLNTLDDMLKGIKEIKLNQKRRFDINFDLTTISAKLKSLKISLSEKYDRNYIFAQSFFFVLLAVVVFILPKYGVFQADKIIQITTSILFIIGPISSVVSVVQIFNEANLAVGTIYELEEKLDMALDTDSSYLPVMPPEIKNFKTIRLEDVEFSYFDTSKNQLFTIGPINLTVNKGETLFIVGGNGCGKTTLLKVIAMLYFPTKGKVFIDDTEITKDLTLQYRELFSAIFSDFHLFWKIYGLLDVSKHRVKELLEEMQIEHKTQFSEDRFTRLDLSTGQRKRIAMIVSLLEDKPVYMFDEWAADQDFEFRNYFYTELLNNLKSKEKTLIIISHDERYFNSADRVVKLDYGKIISDEKKLQS
ncbi:MAG: cyclic peptide export ABC transporter [Bacteroidota bacterium]